MTWLNLSTPAGLLLARGSGCRIGRRDGYWEALGYSRLLPPAAAFTVGAVVICRRPLPESVWQHEVRHIRQYAWCGLLLPPLYGVASAWSLWRTGDWWSRNVFERRAGLAAGGYVERPLRRSGRRGRGGTAVVAAGA